MNVKLIMYWDIKPGRDQEYFEFVVREWVPATTRLGLKVIGAWYSMYRADPTQPRIMAEALADDLETMRDIISGSEWDEIRDRLMGYVTNYSQKIVYTSGDFQF